MQEEVRMCLINLSHVFKKICTNMVDPNNMQVLRAKIVKTLNIIEKVFLLACFDIMMHLFIHLVKELELCGPVHTLWMYPMERYMKALKGYVKNMAQPEGNMATGYSIEKTLGFCTKYIQGVKSTRRKVWDDKEGPTMHDEVLEGSGRLRRLSPNLKSWAHTFVYNATIIKPWYEQVLNLLAIIVNTLMVCTWSPCQIIFIESRTITWLIGLNFVHVVMY